MLFQERAKILIKRAYVKIKSPNSDFESVIYATERECAWTRITEVVISHSEPTQNHILHKYAHWRLYFKTMLITP